MSKEKNEVAIVEQFAIQSVDSAEIAMMIAEAAGSSGITPADLDRIKIPSGGVTQWAVPTLDGESFEKEIRGIIVHHQDVRSYWEKSFEETGGGVQPDCSSFDGITGRGIPGGICSKCPLSQFGSGKGSSQACKAAKILYVLTQDSLLPVAVTCSPGSIKPMKQYLLRLASRGMKPWHVVTTLALEKAKSGDGITYARVLPSVGGHLDATLKASAEAYSASLKPKLGTATIGQDDVDG